MHMQACSQAHMHTVGWVPLRKGSTENSTYSCQEPANSRQQLGSDRSCVLQGPAPYWAEQLPIQPCTGSQHHPPVWACGASARKPPTGGCEGRASRAVAGLYLQSRGWLFFISPSVCCNGEYMMIDDTKYDGFCYLSCIQFLFNESQFWSDKHAMNHSREENRCDYRGKEMTRQ